MAVSKYLEKIANGALLVIISMVFGKLFSYLYVVLVANKLGASNYGVLSLAFAILSFSSALALLGLDEGVIRYVSFYKGRKDIGSAKGTIKTALKTALNTSIVIAVLLIIFSDFISNNIFNEYDLMNLLIFVAVALPFTVTAQIFLVSFRAFQKPQYEVMIKELIEKSSKVIITFILFLFGFRLLGAAAGFVLAIILMSIISVIVFNKYILNFFSNKTQEKENKKELLNYSMPLLLKNFMWFIISWIDILMIGYFKTTSDVGIYNVALPTSSLIIMPAYSIMYLFLPVISQLYGENNMAEIKNVYKKVSKYLLLINIPIFLIIFILSEDIVSLFFGKEYLNAFLPLVILSIGYLSFSLSDISMNMLSVMKKTKTISAVIFLFALVNAVLNYILIPKYGIIGAATATSSSFVVGTILMISICYYHSKLHPFMFNYLKIILSALLTLAAVYFIKKISSYSSLLNIIVFTLLILAVYLLLILITKALDKEDIELVKDLKNKLMFK